MKFKNNLSWFALLTLFLMTWSGISSANQQPFNQHSSKIYAGIKATNLLNNPSFEGEYHAYVPPGGHPDCPFGICTTAQMAEGWTPWWVSHNPEDENHIIRMPEYKAAAPWQNRIHSGANAQQYFSFHSTHRAGFYQRVPVTPGYQYRFSIWGHAWESNDDDPNVSDPTYYPINQRIGIDPTGGTNWNSPNVLWSSPHGQYDEFGFFQVCATAQNGHMTVFTFSEPEWAAKHNDVYWDDAELTRYDQPCQTNLALSSPGGVTFLVEPGQEVQPVSVVVSVPVDPQVSWMVSSDQGGTLTPLIQSGYGLDGDAFILSTNTLGKTVGYYSGSVTVSSDPPVIGSPRKLVVTLFVTPQIHHFYLPMIVK